MADTRNGITNTASNHPRLQSFTGGRKIIARSDAFRCARRRALKAKLRYQASSQCADAIPPSVLRNFCGLWLYAGSLRTSAGFVKPPATDGTQRSPLSDRIGREEREEREELGRVTHAPSTQSVRRAKEC
jgi:hypothetical protein